MEFGTERNHGKIRVRVCPRFVTPTSPEVLVTGGTGVLGSLVVDRLLARGHRVRLLSRTGGADEVPGVRRVRGDLRASSRLEEVTQGLEAIVHCASATRAVTSRRRREVDVLGTRRLLDAAREQGSPHVVYPSIVGIDGHPLDYYRTKRAGEEEVEASGLPWSVLRTTQFHELLLQGLGALAHLPVLPVPRGWRFQPVSAAEVADHLVELVSTGEPHGRADDLGGPEVIDAVDVARTYLGAAGQRRRVVTLPFPGRVAESFRQGRQLCPGCRTGRVTWGEFLQERTARYRR